MDDARRMLEAYRVCTVPDPATRAALLRRLRSSQPVVARWRMWITISIALAAAAALVLVLGRDGEHENHAERPLHPEEAVHGLVDERAAEPLRVIPAMPPVRDHEASVAGPDTTPSPLSPGPRPVPPPQRIERDSPPVPSTAPVLEEARRLARAQAALRDGDPRGALALLDALARDLPGGAMVIEREALRAIATCEAGEPRSARIDAVLAAPDAASYAARIRRACGL